MCQRMSLTQWVRLVWLNYKDVVRLQREKTRGAKAQLELNLAIAVEGAIKCFYKYITKKRRAKETVHWM